MNDARHAAIEAIARTRFARFPKDLVVYGRPSMTWDEVAPEAQRQWLDDSAAELDALIALGWAPRAEVAEEIAVAILDEPKPLVPQREVLSDPAWNERERAADIAREIGRQL